MWTGNDRTLTSSQGEMESPKPTNKRRASGGSRRNSTKKTKSSEEANTSKNLNEDVVINGSGQSPEGVLEDDDTRNIDESTADETQMTGKQDQTLLEDNDIQNIDGSTADKNPNEDVVINGSGQSPEGVLEDNDIQNIDKSTTDKNPNEDVVINGSGQSPEGVLEDDDIQNNEDDADETEDSDKQMTNKQISALATDTVQRAVVESKMMNKTESLSMMISVEDLMKFSPRVALYRRIHLSKIASIKQALMLPNMRTDILSNSLQIIRVKNVDNDLRVVVLEGSHRWCSFISNTELPKSTMVPLVVHFTDVKLFNELHKAAYSSQRAMSKELVWKDRRSEMSKDAFEMSSSFFIDINRNINQTAFTARDKAELFHVQLVHIAGSVSALLSLASRTSVWHRWVNELIKKGIFLEADEMLLRQLILTDWPLDAYLDYLSKHGVPPSQGNFDRTLYKASVASEMALTEFVMKITKDSKPSTSKVWTTGLKKIIEENIIKPDTGRRKITSEFRKTSAHIQRVTKVIEDVESVNITNLARIILEEKVTSSFLFNDLSNEQFDANNSVMKDLVVKGGVLLACTENKLLLTKLMKSGLFCMVVNVNITGNRRQLLLSSDVAIPFNSTNNKYEDVLVYLESSKKPVKKHYKMISDEQIETVQAALVKNNTILLEARTGSGKTTRLLPMLCIRFPSVKFVYCTPKKAALDSLYYFINSRHQNLSVEIVHGDRAERNSVRPQISLHTPKTLRLLLAEFWKADIRNTSYSGDIVFILDEYHNPDLYYQELMQDIVRAQAKSQNHGLVKDKINGWKHDDGLSDVARRNSEWKLVLMSATLDHDSLSSMLSSFDTAEVTLKHEVVSLSVPEEYRREVFNPVMITMSTDGFRLLSKLKNLPGMTSHYRQLAEDFIVETKVYASIMERLRLAQDMGIIQIYDYARTWLKFPPLKRIDLLGSGQLDLDRHTRHNDNVGLAVTLVKNTMENEPVRGALIFVSGKGTIDRTVAALKVWAEENEISLIPVHAKYYKIVERPRWMDADRFIIVSTSLLEDSVTIENLHLVIDTAAVPSFRWCMKKRVHQVETVPISMNSRRQREGRIGRTSDGVLYSLGLEEPQHANTLSDMEYLCGSNEIINLIRGDIKYDDLWRVTDGEVAAESALCDILCDIYSHFVYPPGVGKEAIRRFAMEIVEAMKEHGLLDEECNLTALAKFVTNSTLPIETATLVFHAFLNKCVPSVLLTCALQDMDYRLYAIVQDVSRDLFALKSTISTLSDMFGGAGEELINSTRLLAMIQGLTSFERELLMNILNLSKTRVQGVMEAFQEKLRLLSSRMKYIVGQRWVDKAKRYDQENEWRSLPAARDFGVYSMRRCFLSSGTLGYYNAGESNVAYCSMDGQVCNATLDCSVVRAPGESCFVVAMKIEKAPGIDGIQWSNYIVLRSPDELKHVGMVQLVKCFKNRFTDGNLSDTKKAAILAQATKLSNKLVNVMDILDCDEITDFLSRDDFVPPMTEGVFRKSLCMSYQPTVSMTRCSECFLFGHWRDCCRTPRDIIQINKKNVPRWNKIDCRSCKSVFFVKDKPCNPWRTALKRIFDSLNSKQSQLDPSVISHMDFYLRKMWKICIAEHYRTRCLLCASTQHKTSMCSNTRYPVPCRSCGLYLHTSQSCLMISTECIEKGISLYADYCEKYERSNLAGLPTPESILPTLHSFVTGSPMQADENDGDND